MSVSRALFSAFKRFYEEAGFSLSSAIAFALVLSLFPFMVFVAAIAGFIGAEEHAEGLLRQFFTQFPPEVRDALIPEIQAVVKKSHVGIMTFGGIMMMFFASNGVESMRGAFNRAYRDIDERSYIWIRIQGMLFVIECAFVMVIVGGFILLAPQIATELSLYAPKLVDILFTQKGAYLLSLFFVVMQFFLFHRYLPAANHDFLELLPGILLSVILWVIGASLFSTYLRYSNYEELYGGLAKMIVALIFFQITAAIIILGANFNRALISQRLQAAKNESSTMEKGEAPTMVMSMKD